MPDFKLQPYFDECVDWIHKQRQHTNVYVHCFAGVSRSATVVIAYMIKMEDMKYSKALKYVKSKRSVVCPN